MEISAAIFDMDGTIIDSMKYYKTLGQKYLDSLGVKDSGKFSEYFFTYTSLQMAELLIKDIGVLKTKEEIIFEINEIFLALYKNVIEAKKGIVEFLKYLKEKEIPIVLLTASDRKIAEPCLRRNHLYEYFDEKIFCSEHNQSKHNKDIFLYACKKINAKIESTFVFEDALYAIETAKKCGFKICGILDSWCKEDWKAIKELSDIYAFDFEEVMAKCKNQT